METVTSAREGVCSEGVVLELGYPSTHSVCDLPSLIVHLWGALEALCQLRMRATLSSESDLNSLIFDRL